ncbi:hypothetical protein KAT63_04385 [Candidatus Parcubacteria bacterium]|nr:hypothetical protein [Candidatus Parcubacteria bacterium]
MNSETKDRAIIMAKELNKFFQQLNIVGIVGGTERAAETSGQEEEALSPVDFCLVGDFGLCNVHKSLELNEVNIKTFNAVYGSSGKVLEEEMANRHIYQSGGFIANPSCALTMADILPERINDATIEELIKNSRVPVTFDIAPLEIQPEDYQKSREEFRKGSGRNWILRVVNPQARYFVPTNEGYKQLDPEKVEQYVKAWIPDANGTDFLVDYGILAKVPNPVSLKYDVLGCWGCHKWGTLAWNAAIMMTEEMPEIKVRGINETLAFMRDVIKGESLQHYEVIATVLNRPPTPDRDYRELTIAPVGIFEVT